MLMRITMTPKDPQKEQKIFEGVIHFETYTECGGGIRECVKFDWAEKQERNLTFVGLHREDFCLNDYTMTVEMQGERLTACKGK